MMLEYGAIGRDGLHSAKVVEPIVMPGQPYEPVAGSSMTEQCCGSLKWRHSRHEEDIIPGLCSRRGRIDAPVLHRDRSPPTALVLEQRTQAIAKCKKVSSTLLHVHCSTQTGDLT